MDDLIRTHFEKKMRESTSDVMYYVQPVEDFKSDPVPEPVHIPNPQLEGLQEKLPHEEILIPRFELDELINECLKREWGVSDDPDDLGGPTAYGITHKVARSYGYQIDEITPELAKQIFEHRYYFEPKINFIPDRRLQWRLLLDGLNSGSVRVIKRLQEILNFQNNFGTSYPDITVDGYLGSQTFQTLRKAKEAFKRHYSHKASTETQLSELFWQHMCLQMHALQYAWYHDIVKRKPEQEKWYRGWKNRIAFPPAFYKFDTGNQ